MGRRSDCWFWVAQQSHAVERTTALRCSCIFPRLRGPGEGSHAKTEPSLSDTQRSRSRCDHRAPSITLPEELASFADLGIGTAMAQHVRLKIDANPCLFCFCDPRSPLQRGTNEKSQRAALDHTLPERPRAEAATPLMRYIRSGSSLNATTEKDTGMETAAEALTILLSQ